MFSEDILDCDGMWCHEERYIDMLAFTNYIGSVYMVAYNKAMEGDNVFLF